MKPPLFAAISTPTQPPRTMRSANDTCWVWAALNPAWVSSKVAKSGPREDGCKPWRWPRACIWDVYTLANSPMFLYAFKIPKTLVVLAVPRDHRRCLAVRTQGEAGGVLELLAAPVSPCIKRGGDLAASIMTGKKESESESQTPRAAKGLNKIGGNRLQRSRSPKPP